MLNSTLDWVGPDFYFYLKRVNANSNVYLMNDDFSVLKNIFFTDFKLGLDDGQTAFIFYFKSDSLYAYFLVCYIIFIFRTFHEFFSFEIQIFMLFW